MGLIAVDTEPARVTERTYTAAELRTLASRFCSSFKSYGDMQYQLHLSLFLSWLAKQDKENQSEQTSQ